MGAVMEDHGLPPLSQSSGSVVEMMRKSLGC